MTEPPKKIVATVKSGQMWYENKLNLNPNVD